MSSSSSSTATLPNQVSAHIGRGRLRQYHREGDPEWSKYSREATELMMGVPHAREQMGSSVGRTSPGWSIRNSCSKMSTSQPRIESSEPTFPPVCACRILNDPPSLRSVSGSAALRFSRSPASPDPIPSSPGTGGLLPANSTDPNSVPHPAGRHSARMPIQTHSVWRSFVTPGVNRVHRSSSL